MKENKESENLYWMLLQVAFRAKHGLMKLAETHDLTVMQLYTLCSMTPREPIPMNTISCMLFCDASNVTGIVDRLLSQGYIAREEKPEDRRVKMISLTLKGEKLRKELLEALVQYELPEFKQLTITQNVELKSLLSLILQPSPVNA
ncbi:MAG TPA: MarR family transcriptional regulator [Candidatus Saccharimonadales bacterium]|nr:MarR family transcriptional regulator [Candidatus Saccharimonadales bacterium]